MRIVTVILITACLAVTVGCGSNGSGATMMRHMGDLESDRAAGPESSKATVVHSISLPHDEGFAPPGPSRDAFVTACVVCHSPLYITSQPPISRKVWEGIVEKMIDAYGAHITARQAADIVNYLASTGGANSIGEEE